MTRTQQNAWFNLIVLLLTFTAVLALWPLCPGWNFAALGLLTLIPCGGLFWVRFRGRPAVLADERDGEIVRRSKAAANTALWVTLVIANWVPLFFYKSSIPVIFISLAAFLTGIAWVAILSIAILLQYHWAARHAA